jgi:hypothetical protein
VEILQLLCDILCALSEGHYALNELEGKALRSLIIQSLHGAAPESVRDATLRCCVDLLRAQSILDPQWTVKDSFPIFLCSIVYGELHLLEESLLYFLREHLNNSSI